MIEKEAINVMIQAREDAGQAFLGKVQCGQALEWHR